MSMPLPMPPPSMPFMPPIPDIPPMLPMPPVPDMPSIPLPPMAPAIMPICAPRKARLMSTTLSFTASLRKSTTISARSAGASIR